MLRELLHCAQFVQSHALSFFHLSAPDLLLGMDSDPARRNVLGADRAASGTGARRHRAAQVRAAGDRRAGAGAHPSFVDGAGRSERAARPGSTRHAFWRGLPAAKAIVAAHARRFSKAWWTGSGKRSRISATRPRCTRAWWTRKAACSFTTASCVSRTRRAISSADQIRPQDYAAIYRRRRRCATTYLKAPYYKPLGYPEGVYRVGPLARLNVADRCGTPAGGRGVRRIPSAVRALWCRARSTITMRG